jgi:hypothetical protein
MFRARGKNNIQIVFFAACGVSKLALAIDDFINAASMSLSI